MKRNLFPLLGLAGIAVCLVVAAVTVMGPLTGNVFSTINTSLYAGAPSGGSKGAGALPTAAATPPPRSKGDVDEIAANGPNTLPGQQTGRMIIKNADIKLQVEDTDAAIDRATQLIGDVGGYIISSRVWYQEYSGSNYKYATITVGVPVDQFENAMRRLRGLALRVLDENASGQDVTSEFVDLQSQLDNLEATRERIRSFLEDAKTVEESLKINTQLTEIEGQIGQIKGRMNYLTGRSSYSTITINLEPKLPELTPTPTPTPRLTPTPTAWNPARVFDAASTTLTITYQSIIEVLIWLLIAVVPVLVPPALVIWAIWKFLSRKDSIKPPSQENTGQ